MKSFRRIFFKRFALFLILPILVFDTGGSYYHVVNLEIADPIFRKAPIELISVPAYPIKKSFVSFPEVSAKSLYALDLESHVSLLEKNVQDRLPTASLTKLMTALVVLDYCDPKKVVTVNQLPKDGSLMGLFPGEKVTVESLLYGLLLPSGNDAAYALAENCPGSVEQFVYSMNQKAQFLGMKNTHFTNPAGFDDVGHYSTAYDLAILATESLKNELISKIIKTKAFIVTDAGGQAVHQLKNRNDLLSNPEVLGIKTGKTQKAGENLILARKKEGHTIIVIILGSKNRFSEGQLISDWIFGNFSWHNF